MTLQIFRALVLTFLLTLMAPMSAKGLPQPDKGPRQTFALKIFQSVTAASPRGNVAISPLSLGHALALVGHVADGPTAREVDQLLGLPVHRDPAGAVAELNRAAGEVEGSLLVRSALWVPARLPLQGSFSIRPFDAPVEKLPAEGTAASAAINAWAARATHGMLTQLVDPTIDTGGFVVTNATYFKGVWRARFDPQATSEQDFHARDETPHHVPMMKHKDIRAMYWSHGDLEAVRLPFQGGLLDYVIITSQSRASGDEILKSLAEDNRLEEVCRGIGFERRRGVVQIPRHRIEFGMDLKESLMHLGLTQPFSQGADFTGLTPAPLTLASVRHRAVLNVDESGAEAAAATATITLRSAFEDEPHLDFIADRPFVALLVNSDAPAWPVMMTLVRDL